MRAAVARMPILTEGVIETSNDDNGGQEYNSRLHGPLSIAQQMVAAARQWPMVYKGQGLRLMKCDDRGGNNNMRQPRRQINTKGSRHLIVINHERHSVETKGRSKL